MSTDPHDEEVIERLERLGNWTPPGLSSERAIARVRQSLAQKRIQVPVTRGRFHPALAAALILIAAGSLVLGLVRLPASAQASFAQVQAAVESTKSMTCRQVMRTKGEPVEIQRMQLLASGVLRSVTSDGYTLTDTKRSRALLVDDKKRTATLMMGINIPNVNLYEMIRTLPADASARPLPAKKIDGNSVLGFVVQAPPPVKGELTVWVDPKTKLAVRIESELRDEKKVKVGEVVMDEFVYDPKLDERLFSFDPPAGYTFKKVGSAILGPAPGEAEAQSLVITPLVGIGTVKFGMTRIEVETALGKPESAEEIGQQGAVNLIYSSRGLFIAVGKVTGVNSISVAVQKTTITRIHDFPGKTAEGIKLGSSPADVRKAYGEPNSKSTNEGSTYYTYNKLQAEFTFFGEELVQMWFRLPRP